MFCAGHNEWWAADKVAWSCGDLIGHDRSLLEACCWRLIRCLVCLGILDRQWLLSLVCNHWKSAISLVLTTFRRLSFLPLVKSNNEFILSISVLRIWLRHLFQRFNFLIWQLYGFCVRRRHVLPFWSNQLCLYNMHIARQISIEKNPL